LYTAHTKKTLSLGAAAVSDQINAFWVLVKIVWV